VGADRGPITPGPGPDTSLGSGVLSRRDRGRPRRAGVEQKPSWTGIWFKVECSLRRRVTVRPWNPGNGGNLSEGDKEYNMGDETKRPTV